METGQQVSEKAAESRFRSRSEHALDEKGRLNIPARFREVLQHTYTEQLMVTNWEKSLKAFPVSIWLELEDKLNKERNTQKIAAFVRYVISGVVECPLDKQGRIHLPGSLREEFRLDKDVVLVGMLDHFEIWDKGAWQDETRSTRDNFKDFEQGLASLGIL
ncbi:MAG: division/cell wall cluster transcriptional repressor MraZ [Desulfobulbaceae bacterium]